jgi:GT2 family glycosyltransferase
MLFIASPDDLSRYNTGFVETGLVSAVVVNWNRRDLLRKCLISLKSQRDVRLETIVVDNGSTDGSQECIEAEFPEVRLIRNGENRGFCAANNQGIAAARGEFVALLNNDAEADAGWAAAMVKVAGEERVGMVACKILVHGSGRMIDKVGHLIYPDGQNRGRGTGCLDEGQFDRVEEVLWPDGCAALYRKEMLNEIGGFDEDLFAYADDAELGLRARIAGWICLYTPHAVARHHRGNTLGVGSVRRLKLIERNRVLLAAKLFPWSLLWMNPFYYVARLAAGAGSAMRGEGETALFPGWRGKWRLVRAMVGGDWEALWMLPRMLRKRRAMKRIARLTPAQVKQLILDNRIDLRELTTQAAIR